MKKATLCATTEIVSTIAYHNIEDKYKNDLIKNPKEFILKELNIDLSNIDINIVENDNENVNLSLPYYSQVETLKAGALSEEDLENITGGEILFVLLPASIGAAVGAGAAIAAFGGAGAAALTTALSVGIAVGGAAGAAVGVAATGGVIAGIHAGEKAKKEGHK